MTFWEEFLNLEGIIFLISSILCILYWSSCPFCPCVSLTQLNASVKGIKEQYGQSRGFIVFIEPAFKVFVVLSVICWMLILGYYAIKR